MNYIKRNDLEVSIGLSRKWDARDAGREVAKSAIKNLKKPPSFFLLFSTIHYKNHGGFQKFLDGVWEVLPKGTPLIGGTVACFINNHGCYARGATALALSYSNLDVAVGLGRHTKLNPKNAARKCSNFIKLGLKNSKFSNKLLINIISAPTVPKIPIFGRNNFIKSKFFGWLASTVGVRLFPLFGHGLGKEDDVIDKLTQLLPDYYFIGGSAVDSGKYLNNYQFIEDQVFTNSVVALGCKIDLPFFMKSVLGVHETDKTFNITGEKYDNRIITEIDNKPAKEQFLKILGITEDQFKNIDVFYSRASNYFPITFEEDKNYTTGTAGFLGNDVALGYKARGKKARMLSITGKEIIDAIDLIFDDHASNKFPFVFMSSSFIFLNTLGDNSYLLKEKLDCYLKEVPYLVIFPTAENAGTPDDHAITRVYSLNAMSLKSNFNSLN